MKKNILFLNYESPAIRDKYAERMFYSGPYSFEYVLNNFNDYGIVLDHWYFVKNNTGSDPPGPEKPIRI